MNVKLTKKPIPTVTVEGEIDLHSSDKVDAAIEHACHLAASIILDFSKVAYLDSAGVRSILLGVRTESEKGGQVVVIVKNRDVRRIIDMATGGVPNLPIVSSLEAAKKYLDDKR